MAKCPNCGKQNKVNAKFCEDCGTALNKVPNTPKQDNIQKSEQSDKPASILDQIKSFWNARDKKGKAITSVAVCCLGVIIIGAIGGVLFPDKHISIGFNNATYDGLGAYHVDINNSTTEYVISGYTEDGANLTVSSSDLNISAQRINLTSGNGFTYNVNMPANVDSAKIRFEAVKAGKENTSVELTIKKVSTQVSSQTTNTTPATTQPTTTTNNTPSASSDTSASGIQVVVKYAGSWSGAYGDESGETSVDGSGTKTIQISGSPSVVSADFQKQDGGHGTLTVEIVQDGTVVESKSTSAAYGVATVAHSFF